MFCLTAAMFMVNKVLCVAANGCGD